MRIGTRRNCRLGGVHHNTCLASSNLFAPTHNCRGDFEGEESVIHPLFAQFACPFHAPDMVCLCMGSRFSAQLRPTVPAETSGGSRREGRSLAPLQGESCWMQLARTLPVSHRGRLSTLREALALCASDELARSWSDPGRGDRHGYCVSNQAAWLLPAGPTPRILPATQRASARRTSYNVLVVPAVQRRSGA